MRKIILFDIDFTIFNSDKFREQIYSQIARACGRDYDESFIGLTKEAEDFSKKTVGYYDPKTFLQFIKDQTHTSLSIAELENVLWNDSVIASSIYEDVESVLQALEKSGVIIGTLSTGETYFQAKKIEVLKSFFAKEHIHIFANKLDNIADTISKYKTEKLFLVDDLPHVLSEGKKVNQAVTTILIRRPKKHEPHGGAATLPPDFTIVRFSELEAIVERD